MCKIQRIGTSIPEADANFSPQKREAWFCVRLGCAFAKFSLEFFQKRENFFRAAFIFIDALNHFGNRVSNLCCDARFCLKAAFHTCRTNALTVKKGIV